MTWTTNDDLAFADHCANPSGYELQRLRALVGLLLTHDFSVGIGVLNGSWGVTLTLDGWYSDVHDAAEAVERWEELLDDIRAIVSRRVDR